MHKIRIALYDISYVCVQNLSFIGEVAVYIPCHGVPVFLFNLHCMRVVRLSARIFKGLRVVFNINFMESGKYNVESRTGDSNSRSLRLISRLRKHDLHIRASNPTYAPPSRTPIAKTKCGQIKRS